jgi:hypothetical protein
MNTGHLFRRSGCLNSLSVPPFPVPRTPAKGYGARWGAAPLAETRWSILLPARRPSHHPAETARRVSWSVLMVVPYSSILMTYRYSVVTAG